MPSLGQLIDLLTLSSVDVAALAILLIFLPLFVVFTVRAKIGARFVLRPIRAYERIRQLVSQATESDKPLHVSLGTGQIGSQATPEALMGATVFDYVARYAAAGNQSVLGTTGEPTLLASAQGLLQKARREAGAPERYAGRELSFSGPDPLAYVAGTHNVLRHQPHLANILVGRFGHEGLWLAETTRREGIPQLGGTADPSAAALMRLSLDEAVIGEEVYAAGAYLHRPSHLGSLAAQDVMRVVAILAILVGVVMTSLGYWR